MSELDEALERFAQVDFEYGGGLSSHGPMAAEALATLGHAALIPAFVDRYVPRLPPAPPRGRSLSPAERVAARGDDGRAADWLASFEADLAARPAGDVVREAVPPLLPGLFGAAGHGLLRTMHALRSLEREDVPLRRGELARGLAYWSARVQTLPGTPGTASGEAAPAPAPPVASSSAFDARLEAAFDACPTLAWNPSAPESFVAAARRLDALPEFRAAVDSVPLPAADVASGGGDPLDGVDAFLAALCRASARRYRAHPDARIAYAHAVTVPAAMRWLASRLPPEAARAGAGYALQAALAFHAIAGGSPRSAGVDPEVEQTARSWDEIRYRAACSLDEHAIKLALACWLEDRNRPDPDLRLAAADAALRIDGGRGGTRC